MRWSWRVGFYTYHANGTDKYPPFTLEPVDDYPADLQVVYPERLSQGLVLIKWWLLAIPHLIIVSIFSGGWGWGWGQLWWGGEGTGLIVILVIIAAVVLLFTGKYNQDIFKLVMGMNRWVYRVVAYTALMTDEYPPFRIGD